MANKKFTELPELSLPTGATEIAVVESGVSKKISWNNLHSKLGGSANYIEINSSGELFLRGDATVWDDMRVPFSAGLQPDSGSRAPSIVQIFDDGISSRGIYVTCFEDNAVNSEQEMYFAVQLPHSYKEGSDIEPHVHWVPDDTETGDVVWGLEYTWASIDGTYPVTSIITTVGSARGTRHQHTMTDFTPIDGTGKGISSMLSGRLFRNSSNVLDTYANGACLLEFDFHFEMDTMGSRLEASK